MLGEGLMVYGIPVIYPFMRNELALGGAQVGLITSALFATSIFTVTLGGWLSDSFGAKRILVGSLTYSAVALFFFAITKSLLAAIVAALFIGVGVGPFYSVTSKAIIDWLPVRLRGFGMSVKQTGPAAGGALAAVTLPVVAVASGWSVAIMGVAGVQILLAAVLFLLYKDPPSQTATLPKLAIRDIMEVIKERDLLILTIWGFFFFGLLFVVQSFLILFIVEHVGYSEVAAGAYLSAALIVSTVARVAWGTISDVLLSSRRKSTLALLSAVAVVALLGASAMAEGASPVFVGTVAVAMGVTVLSWPGVFAVYVAEVAGASRAGTATGATNSVMRIGVVALPPLFGLLVDVAGSYSLAWAIAAGVAAVATAVLLLWAKEPIKHTEGSD